MGIELELAVLLGICIVGPAVFSVFEGETAAWRKILKWGIVCGATLLVYRTVGHLALIFPIGLSIVGLTFHFWWCRKHAIHPLRATPRRRYYDLREWEWPE